jgi:hypothetical protein
MSLDDNLFKHRLIVVDRRGVETLVADLAGSGFLAPVRVWIVTVEATRQINGRWQQKALKSD